MNYCTKCQSWYDKPGTCNCYGPAAPPAITLYGCPARNAGGVCFCTGACRGPGYGYIRTNDGTTWRYGSWYVGGGNVNAIGPTFSGGTTAPAP